MKKMNSENRVYKILIFVGALFLAFLLWVYAIGYDTETTTDTYSGITVELTGNNVNGFTVAESNFSLTIDVVASGTRSALNNVSSSDFTAYVDISNVTDAGYATLPVNVVAPNGLEVTSISTQNVTLYIDVFTSKTMTVQVDRTFTSQYVIGETLMSTYAVNVYGPQSILNDAEAYISVDLGTITSATVSVSGVVQLRDASTKTAISNAYITMSSNSIDVTFVMYDTRTVPLTISLTGGLLLAEDVQTTIYSDGAELYGPVSELNSISSLSIFVNETEITDSVTDSISAQDLLTANGVSSSVEATEPERVITYTVTIPELKTKTIHVSSSRISMENSPEGVRATVNESIDVTILGTPTAVKSFTADQLTVILDYNSLELQPTSGDYLGTATIYTNTGSVCVIGEPYTVLVSISGNN